jgi:hypothetical protein
MFVALEIHTKPKASLLRVKETAVQPGNKVWRVRDGRLREVDVRIVEIADRMAVVQAASDLLQAGDEVVVSPLAEIPEGMLEKEPDAGAAAGSRQVALATEAEGK